MKKRSTTSSEVPADSLAKALKEWNQFLVNREGGRRNEPREGRRARERKGTKREEMGGTT